MDIAFGILAVVGLAFSVFAVWPATFGGIPATWARPMVFWAVSAIILLITLFARMTVSEMLGGIAAALIWIVFGLIAALRSLVDQLPRNLK